MNKNKASLLMFDDMPSEMKVYLSHYGLHFNKKMCDYAVSMMKKKEPSSDKMTRITPMSKSEVEDILKKHNIELTYDCLYDSTYVANMLMADMYKSSLEDEKHLAMGVKDVIDDPDAADGSVFVAWYAKTMHAGHPIDWADML